MKVQVLFGSLFIIFMVGILSPGFVGSAISSAAPARPGRAGNPDAVPDQPAPVDPVARRQAEERILKSTVRIYIETWVVRPDDSGYDIDATASHATLKDGRFLVTHNHFSAPWASQEEDPQPGYATVTLANSEGKALYKGALSDFEVVWEDPETLVIAHKDVDLFETLGFISADFEDWTSAPLEPDAEVAQVDWDGTTTRVDWTTVEEIAVDDGVPRLVLADGITLGASGGGIFWQGKHIANNWLLVQGLNASGELIDANTKGALNSAPIAGSLSSAVASS